MKSFLALLTVAATASAHYTFPALVAGGTTTGQWQYVRKTTNYQSNGPVTDVCPPFHACLSLSLSHRPHYPISNMNNLTTGTRSHPTKSAATSCPPAQAHREPTKSPPALQSASRPSRRSATLARCSSTWPRCRRARRRRHGMGVAMCGSRSLNRGRIFPGGS